MTESQPAILTVFGIRGDLARRKLLPSLYHLADAGLLPEPFRIVGVSRGQLSEDELCEQIKQTVEDNGSTSNPETIQKLKDSLSTVSLDVTKGEDYDSLKKELDRIEDELGVCLNRLFYLAIPSNLFGPLIEQLGNHGLNSGCQHEKADSQLLIEKPFGYDLESAEELTNTLGEAFTEEQIYRIDHYLAKETVQNILKFRSENPLFKGTWSREHISHIMITAAESIGIEWRTNFYEQTGAVRDLVQSHMLQLLALITMELPESDSPEAIHAAKAQLLSQVQPPADDQMAARAVRGQYDSYTQEVGNPKTQTETYAAIQLEIDNPRWDQVPILLRTGKALAEKVTEATLLYRDPERPECTNALTIRFQPNEGIVLDLRIKKPGFKDDIEHIQMDFCYSSKSGNKHPDAYERILYDALRQDKTLFTGSQEVMEGWRIVAPILHAWETERCALHIYGSGSWGPKPADYLAAEAGTHWLTGDLNVCSLPPNTTTKKEL